MKQPIRVTADLNRIFLNSVLFLKDGDIYEVVNHSNPEGLSRQITYYRWNNETHMAGTNFHNSFAEEIILN